MTSKTNSASTIPTNPTQRGLQRADKSLEKSWSKSQATTAAAGTIKTYLQSRKQYCSQSTTRALVETRDISLEEWKVQFAPRLKKKLKIGLTLSLKNQNRQSQNHMKTESLLYFEKKLSQWVECSLLLKEKDISTSITTWVRTLTKDGSQWKTRWLNWRTNSR